jgi:putative transposase
MLSKIKNEMKNLTSKNNAKFLLLVHLIFVVKYRKKLLSIYGTEVKNKIIEIAGRNNFEIDTIEVDTDHIHLLVSYEPKVSISQIVKALKSQTTIYLWDKYSNNLKNYFWYKNIFWSSGYFACSVGNASQEVIRKYIEEQG